MPTKPRTVIPPTDNIFLPGLLWAGRLVLALACLPLRWGNVPALLLHGLGHALCLYAVTGERSAFDGKTLLEGIKLKELALSLLPWHPLPQFSDNPPRLARPLAAAWQYRLVAVGGALMNAIGMVIAGCVYAVWAHDGSVVAPELVMLLGFMASSLLAMWSVPDLTAFIQGHAPYWACGPAFAVRYKLPDTDAPAPLLSERLRELVEILAREASTRGGQSGGFSIIVKKLQAWSIIFDKAVKGKREDIVKVISGKLGKLLEKAAKEGYSRPGGFEVTLLHLRYATGGATHWHNAQPHWYEHFDWMMHHRVENGQLVSHYGEVFNMIAHNGDMDGVHLDVCIDQRTERRYFSQMEARAILTAAMPSTTSQGNSDSRSVAEWVDFVYTQGLAYKALRYAAFTSALDFNQEICRHKFDLFRLYTWAEAVDLAISKARAELGEHCLNLRPGLTQEPAGSLSPRERVGVRELKGHDLSRAQSIEDLCEAAKQKVRAAVLDCVQGHMNEATATRFIAAFEDAFYRHDLAWVMRRASRDLVGEFALMVCTTLEPRLGIFSLTQAFSLGHNRTLGEIFGSAEPQGVTSALQRGNPDDDAVQIYLEDGQYATVDYSPLPGMDPIRIYNRAEPSDDLSRRPQPAPGTLLDDHPAATGALRCDWFAINHNPKIDRYTRLEVPGTEVERDIQDIPYNLQRVVQSFAPQGENHATLENFCGLVLGNLLDPRRDPGKHDLVLFGVDFNQDLIGEFALALRSILPGLRIRAENSGNVLKEMKRSKREGIGSYGDKTLFLGVSNSAQTQSTLAALRKARDLVGAQRCFVLTQSALNSMSQALGQGYHPEDPLLPNTFLNLSHLAPDGSCGRRRAEAATLVPVATQAVLTEILIGLTQRALELRETQHGVYPHTPGRDTALGSLPERVFHTERHSETDAFGLPLPRGEGTVFNQRFLGRELEIRHDLQWIDIQAFRDFQTAVYQIEIPNRVGHTAEGWAIDTPDSAALEAEAQARAENNIEFVRAWAIFAGYIVIATVFGVPIFGVLSAPLQFIGGIGLIAHVLDAALFLSALWLIHCGIRHWQGRPVLERIGARAELYIDRRYIARMIERYNATLFSNAPAFLTPYFYWADTVQDALHRFGIRAHRGVVTIHRTPDERLGVEEANNAAEENMVFAQIGGIRFNHGQPQSRDKVRHGSYYMNRSERDHAAKPYQTVLSDSLEPLRQKYEKKLSPETLRLINRRLIDLADGLVVEFVIGERRKALVNRAVWEVMRWIPGSFAIYQTLLNYGIDLMNLTGAADTANQAQIQSTKHPVSPMDIHVDTMAPRSVLESFNKSIPADDAAFAVFAFFDNAVSITFNPALGAQASRLHGGQSLSRAGRGNDRSHLPPQIWLQPGAGWESGTLVSVSKDRTADKFIGGLRLIDGVEHLVIDNAKQDYRISLPTTLLSEEQRGFLTRNLDANHGDDFAKAA
ncbi:MAG: hypothetical protein EPN21_08360 [Methylococcaceae bacterium]|nr:MAG: hypothetical protein EPN21_08360 [Methylococcaceae bacterium]